MNPCTRIYFGGVMTKKNKNNGNKVVVIHSSASNFCKKTGFLDTFNSSILL